MTEKGIRVIFDISSPKLKELLRYEPLLIKPNDEEIEEIVGMKTSTEEEIIHVLTYL